MRKLLILTLASLASVAPALAQGAPQNAATGPNAVEDQEAPDLDLRSIEGSIQMRLALAGFTDIAMVPTSFLVRAKDRDGKPVMLMLSPDGIADLNAVNDQDSGPTGQDSGQDESPRSETPQARPAFPGANDAE